MAANKDFLPETFDSIEAIADFWDSHDLTDYEEYLTPVEVTVSTEPTQMVLLNLSNNLALRLRQAQQQEGMSINDLVNLWVEEKLQQYAL